MVSSWVRAVRTFVKLLKDNPELTEELQYKVLVKLGIIEEEAEEQAVASESEGNDPLDELAEDF